VVLDIEFTLNRWGFGLIAPNKLQLGCFRLAVWEGLGKHALSFEINWKVKA
jgi:hypothetical protein